MGKKPVRGLVGLCWVGLALAGSGGCSWWGGSNSSYPSNGRLTSTRPTTTQPTTVAQTTQPASGVVQTSQTSSATTANNIPTGGAWTQTPPPQNTMTASGSSPVATDGLPQTRPLPSGPAWQDPSSSGVQQTRATSTGPNGFDNMRTPAPHTGDTLAAPPSFSSPPPVPNPVVPNGSVPPSTLAPTTPVIPGAPLGQSPSAVPALPPNPSMVQAPPVVPLGGPGLQTLPPPDMGAPAVPTLPAGGTPPLPGPTPGPLH
jgi:hypothetical protein